MSMLTAITALKLGDHTAASDGHLTLDPMIQMGPMSLGILALFGIAWGAVPINPANLSPGGNGGRGICRACGKPFLVVDRRHCSWRYFDWTSGVVKVWATPRNFCSSPVPRTGVLFLFNMLPVPLLDVWKVLGMFLSPHLRDQGTKRPV